MGKNTSISLGSHFEKFINYSIASGKYSSASEVVRSALRLLELEEQKLNILREVLADGENSTMIEDFDADKQLANIHKKHL
ncbi:MAG: type II toxin-antitoxin system ParD family antitoxin [Tenuifilaceae bacterium]|jgi:antitoxin ParD1/3/4|nr:type II toxin-antitoxin system ParD family antitoxin [Tenuifilaceae bacterium]